MNNFINTVLFLSVLVLASCSENSKNIPITGADITSDNLNEDDSVSKSNSEDTNISVSDNVDGINKEKEDIFTEELLEVGDRVFFDYDQSRFKNEGVETLKRQARFLQENSNITITIEGHCDARGTREYNLALGERRAYAVKSFLTSLGIDEERISVISYGKEKLQATGNNEQAWAESRTAVTVINP